MGTIFLVAAVIIIALFIKFILEQNTGPESEDLSSTAAEVVAGFVIHDTMEVLVEQLAAPPVVLAEKGRTTNFRLVYNFAESDMVRQNILSIKRTFQDELHVTLPAVNDRTVPAPYEIIVGSTKRDTCRQLMESLDKDEYAIRVITDDPDQSAQVLIAYNGGYARMAALDRFLKEYIIDGEVVVPSNLDIRDRCGAEEAVITAEIPRLRDPFVLADNGNYYIYGTGWECWKNSSGSLDGEWESVGGVVSVPSDANDNYWAPEVYRYRNKYYMFTTYSSSFYQHRGVAVFCADSPEGPFEQISAGIVTPTWRNSIDGTLYFDRTGEPWMVYMDEWITAYDEVGSVSAAKLNEELTTFVTQPSVLFRADAAGWATGHVSDGCWMYRCKNGELLMLWSNTEPIGYAVGIARSESGTLDGPWIHDDVPLYSKGLTGDYDGGHPMTFTSPDGQLYLAIHSPNWETDGRSEMPVFVPLREDKGTLIWDLWKGTDDPLWELYKQFVIKAQ